MKRNLSYGPVLITKGSHKGKIGYYDDDEDDKLIIYPNIPIYCTNYTRVATEKDYRRKKRLHSYAREFSVLTF